MDEYILKVENICKYYYIKRQNNLFSRAKIYILKAVNNVNLKMKRKETVAIIGESGSGKTTLGKTIIRIYNPTKGKIWLNNKEISSLRGKELKKIRQKIQMIFQDPDASLNPRQKISDIISLPLRIHLNISKRKIEEKVKKLINLVGLPEYCKDNYPHSLSGGQKQRVGIARALSLEPNILVLDEPTSALDVSVQANILQLLKDLQKELKLTYLLITHDLGLVRNFADRVMVMYLGEIVEEERSTDVFKNPLHPYTKSLLSAIPTINNEEKKLFPEEIILNGEMPSPINMPGGCYFWSRCQEKKLYCKNSKPNLNKVKDEHYVRCFLHCGS